MKTDKNATYVVLLLALTLALLVVFWGGIKSGESKGVASSQSSVMNSCITGSQVTLQNYVFTCQLKGEKIPVTLPSGSQTTIYKAYSQESQ